MNPVRQLRTHAGITQKALARLAGTSQPTIAAYECGKKSPTFDTLQRLARSLSLEINVVFLSPLTREDRRSLAYHQAIVGKLKTQPEAIVRRAKSTLKFMSQNHPDAEFLLNRWQQWLDLPLDDLVACCLDPGTLARDMRQVTPFAGVLSPAERCDALKRMRAEKHHE